MIDVNKQYQKEKDILKFHKSLKSISRSANQNKSNSKDSTDMKKLYKTVHNSKNKVAKQYSRELDNRMKSLNNSTPASTVENMAISLDNDLNQNHNLNFVKKDVKGFEKYQEQAPNFDKHIISNSNTYRGNNENKPLKHKKLRNHSHNNGRHFGQAPSPARV